MWRLNNTQNGLTVDKLTTLGGGVSFFVCKLLTWNSHEKYISKTFYNNVKLSFIFKNNTKTTRKIYSTFEILSKNSIIFLAVPTLPL